MIQQIFTGLRATPEGAIAGCGCACGDYGMDYMSQYSVAVLDYVKSS
jgi:hypothetical protein